MPSIRNINENLTKNNYSTISSIHIFELIDWKKIIEDTIIFSGNTCYCKKVKY